MRAVAFLIALSLLVSSAPVHASETIIVTFDGEWWTSLTQADKITAVQGMIVGYAGGYSDGATIGIDQARIADKKRKLKEALPDPKWIPEEDVAIYDKVLARSTTGDDRVFGTIVAELDNFFNDHPNRAKYLVKYEMFCALTSGQHCK